MPDRNPHVKYSEQVLTIRENGSSTSAFPFRRSRSVRVVFTDPEATDSSSSEDDGGPPACCGRRRRRVKRHVMDIEIQVNSSSLGRRRLQRKKGSMRSIQVEAGSAQQKKFRGVRLRRWGRWSAEIRDPNQHGKRVWLGTYDSAEEAALVYDKSAVRLQGINAVTNFPIGDVIVKTIPLPPPPQEVTKTIMLPVMPEPETITTTAEESPFPSPTSVLRFGDQISAVDCNSYFGYDADVDVFGLGVETALGSMDFYHPRKNRWGEEFGELNTDDFALGSL